MVLRGESVLRRRRRDAGRGLVLGAGVRGRVVVAGLGRGVGGLGVAFGVVRRVVRGHVAAAGQGALALAVDEDRAVDELQQGRGAVCTC